MTSTWAIIPVKSLSEAKGRLAAVLTPEERLGLSRELLRRTLGLLARTQALAQVLVVSHDPRVLSLAVRYGAQPLAETGGPDLNLALGQATGVALGQGAQAVLILPADLPNLSEGDVEQFVRWPGAAPVVVIGPDRHEAGTNALLVRPPGLIDYAFGEGSFQAHVGRAEQAGVRPEICRLPGLALDVDVPEDLHLYRLGQKI